MSKAVKLLTLTTALFGASTIYLGVELHRERGSSPVDGRQGAITAAREDVSSGDTREAAVETANRPATAGGIAEGMGGDQSAPPAPAGPATRSAAADDSADAMPIFARQFLARFDDSAQRGVLLDEARVSVRRQYSRLKEQLKLSDSTFDQLVTLLAEQNLAGQERWARCAVDPGCDIRDASRLPPMDDRTQELLALLGGDGLDSFNEYRDSIGERDAVAQFRGRLSDASYLPEAQAEQLIAALADERERYAREAAQRGVRLTGWGTNLGMIMYPDGIGSIEQQLAEAALYSRRMQDRAAIMLSPEQLAAYRQMQEELLAQMAAYLRPAPRKAPSHKLARG
jgi:hypothetical protein